uniref:Uncharacterized protein n=1 Tax=Arundo donax TaxID=35708 RepID=A0A0A8XP90_ARUDO
MTNILIAGICLYCINKCLKVTAAQLGHLIETLASIAFFVLIYSLIFIQISWNA